MQIIQVQNNNGIYSCDVGISKDEWLEILKDVKTPEAYKATILKFFYMPNHRGTCKIVAERTGDKWQSISSYVTRFGEYVQKRLNRFVVKNDAGKNKFWIVPMTNGKELTSDEEGTFEYELRSELVEAIREYLYLYLVERYKEVRREIPINDSNWTEAYKWQLIADCHGKDLPFIAKRISKENLIDTVRDYSVIKYMLENRAELFNDILADLVDESKSLEERLGKFKKNMKSAVPDTFNSKANDERTAATILTCNNPKKYTFYKYDVYNMFCKFLGEQKKTTGLCYSHFLELIKPLQKLASKDETLQEIVAPSLEEFERNDLLLSQDMLWILLIQFPTRLGFVRSIMMPSKQRVWLWSINFYTDGEGYLECGSSSKTIKDFRKYSSKAALRKAYQEDVGNNDLKIPDAYWAFAKEVKVGDIVVLCEPKKGNGKQYHLLHGWGLFTSDCIIDETNENPMRREVEWHYPFLEIPKQNEEMGNSIFFQGTTDKQAAHIKELLNINTEPIMESKNLILTGAPGTGKTFMAKAIAEEMGAEVGFVQFHPSYDYTDFVEGLRPTDTQGNIGFVRRNGMFKNFCTQALKNLIDSSKTIEVLQNEKSAQDALSEFVTEAIEKGETLQTTSTKKEFVIVGDSIDDIQIEIPKNEKVKTIRLFKNDIIKLLDSKDVFNNLSDVRRFNNRDYGTQLDSYVFAIYSKLKTRIARKVVVDAVERKTFIFIIDEINRGEISKIFGELFFSIDPGYRGTKGKVNTQYQNMIEESDVFKNGFYVPDNVYIIGTMNDIDRSVESMDFAMRRRFAFEEVTAEDSYANMIENEPEFAAVKDEIKSRMFSLNKAIAETEGLNEAYQIGAAYFRKYLDYADREQPFDCLWNNHLKGLLFEYLRGNRKAKELLEKLHKAYNTTNADEQAAHTDEG